MNLDYFNEQLLVDCGCWAGAYKDGSGIEIEYCPIHKAAPMLLKALQALLMAHGRYDVDWQEASEKAEAAIRAAEGKE